MHAERRASEAFARSAAIQIGRFGITVNVAVPGPVQTAWLRAELERDDLPSMSRGSPGYTEHLADTAVFLASSRAGWLTAPVIKASGGHNQ